jgi:hypothetical protein
MKQHGVSWEENKSKRSETKDETLALTKRETLDHNSSHDYEN